MELDDWNHRDRQECLSYEGKVSLSGKNSSAEPWEVFRDMIYIRTGSGSDRVLDTEAQLKRKQTRSLPLPVLMSMLMKHALAGYKS